MRMFEQVLETIDVVTRDRLETIIFKRCETTVLFLINIVK